MQIISAGWLLRASLKRFSRKAAELALKLGPDQSDAHQVLSDIHLVFDWDWPAAERELELAKVSALQGLGSTQGDSSQLALTLGRFDDALKIANKYVADDPLDPQGYLWLSVVELRRGQLPEARAMQISAAVLMMLSPPCAPTRA